MKIDRSLPRASNLLALLLSAACGGLAAAQPASAPPVDAAATAAAAERIMQSAYALGERASAIRAQIPVLSVVVIVPDDAVSYIEAVAGWTPRLRYPVLIDDGSIQATEDIARFVRGFKPSSVVRWSMPKDAKPRDNEPAALPGGVPEHHPKELQALVDRAVARAWGYERTATDVTGFIAHLKTMNLTPPGVVLSNPEDQAWTAGLALAAGRGQPISWVKAPQAPGGTMSVAQAEALVKAADDASKATGLKYDAIGDEIDAISLCMNVPAKFPRGAAPQQTMISTTDVVGRRNFAVAGDQPLRWAWTGTVWGSRPRAAYSAMCSLFLASSKAWIFDGYPDDGAFKAFDGTKAGEILSSKAGMTVDVDDAPQQNDVRWRQRSSKPVDAGLIMVNSKGNADFFDANPGRLKPADVPMLNIPAAVHFVHSWSAADVSANSTVAGRWFEHGVFAYFGSVEEPFLQAFVPTPVLAARLSSHFPWGAATRVESSPIWKLACFGDPLWTLAPAGKRVEPGAEAKLPVEGGTSVADALREHLKGGDFAAAARDLVLLGRDSDVARLTDGTLKDKPGAVKSPFVEAAIPALFRVGRTDLVVECYSRLDNQPAANAYLRDVLWLACQDAVVSAPTPIMLEQLAKNMRVDNRERDEAVVGRRKK